jgi:acetyl-CoA C-acetyltransferase
MSVGIIGIGMHPFGRTEGVSGMQQGQVAVQAALKDAGLGWKDVQFAVGGSQDAGYADTLVTQLGLTGIPFMNVANGCATGGTALSSAINTIEAGQFDLGVVVGFDKHERGAFKVDPKEWGLGDWYAETGLAMTTQFFAMKLQRYMHDYGISEDALVRVAEKAFENGALNPNAWRRMPVSYDEIANSMMLNHPLRKYMFCSPAEGGVALVVCSDKKARQLGLKPVLIKANVMRTRRFGTFEVFSASKALIDTPSVTVDAAQAAFEIAGVSPKEIHIAQLQDTESGAEVMHMAENGFCEHGEQEKMLRDGDTKIHGRLPINTDGGCLANGEPVGASGLRQIHEICLQLRGNAGARQVANKPKLGFTQVYGAPGIAGINILQI